MTKGMFPFISYLLTESTGFKLPTVTAKQLYLEYVLCRPLEAGSEIVARLFLESIWFPLHVTVSPLH